MDPAPRQPQHSRSLAELFIANRPELSPPEVYRLHRALDVLFGILLITNYMRSTGVFFGEEGALGFSITGPLITYKYVEAVIRGLSGPVPGGPDGMGAAGPKAGGGPPEGGGQHGRGT